MVTIICFHRILMFTSYTLNCERTIEEGNVKREAQTILKLS